MSASKEFKKNHSTVRQGTKSIIREEYKNENLKKGKIVSSGLSGHLVSKVLYLKVISLLFQSQLKK